MKNSGLEESLDYDPFEGDFGEVIRACANGNLDSIEWPVPQKTALGVVLASGGYPDRYDTGKKIIGTEKEMPSAFIYHAGTACNDKNELVTSGGRVLTVVGIADTLQEARDVAYSRLETVQFEKMHYRNDIGDKSLKGVK